MYRKALRNTTGAAHRLYDIRQIPMLCVCRKALRNGTGAAHRLYGKIKFCCEIIILRCAAPDLKLKWNSTNILVRCTIIRM